MSQPRPRFSTRDLLGPTALFFGALLLAVAIGIGPLVGANLKKVPLDIDQTWVSDGAASSTLDRCSLDGPKARVAEAALRQQRRILAVRPADSSVVTLQAGTALNVLNYVVDGKAAKPSCDEKTISAQLDRVTLDRRTAAPTGASDIQYDDKHGSVAIPDRRGFTYLLPYAFAPNGVSYFDPITRQSLPMRVAGQESMAGRDVTHFVVEVPETDLSAAQQDPRAVLTKPASWFGTFAGVRPTDKLTATLRHRATRDLYVDRATGVIVAERAKIDEVYRFTDADAKTPTLRAFRLTNVAVTLASDEQTVRDGAEYASSRSSTITLVTRIIPLVAGIGGLLLLALGSWLLVRGPKATATAAQAPQSTDE